MIAAGKSSIELDPSASIELSLIAPESDDKLKGLPDTSACKTAITNVEIEVQKKTRHSMLKVQNVFGFEIS
jgi:hypothetical protein